MEIDNIGRLEEKRILLVKRIHLCRELKGKLIRYVNELKERYFNKEIDYEDYNSKLKDTLKGRTLSQWSKYYDDSIEYYNKELKDCERGIARGKRKKVIAPVLITLALLLLIGGALIFLKPEITGFAITQGENISENATFIENITEIIAPIENITETFDNITIPEAPKFIKEYKIKTVDDIINESKISIPKDKIKDIKELSYSSKEVVLKNNKRELIIHAPIINGEGFEKAVPLESKDDYTYTSSFEDTTIEIEFDSKEIKDNKTERMFEKSKINSTDSWKIKYNYLLPSEDFKARFRISSSSPIEVVDNYYGIIKTGKFNLDFIAEVENNFNIEINQINSNIIYIYLNKNYNEYNQLVNDEIIIDPTLTIDGTTYELCGELYLTYDIIDIKNNGIATICARNATAMTGYVNITLGDNGNFSLSDNSMIEGAGSGATGGGETTSTSAAATQGTDGQTWAAGTTSLNANGGGGGGGRRSSNAASGGGCGGGFGGGGGKGGNTTSAQCSEGGTYGSSTGEILFAGSGGGGQAGDSSGALVGDGAPGGAGLKINASSGWITIYGIINISGKNGSNGDAAQDSGSGAGSGGHIILEAKNLTLGSAARIIASGGKGGNGLASTDDVCGGGGGGGGRVLYIYDTAIISTTFFNATDYGMGGLNYDSDTTGGCTTINGNSTNGTIGTIAHVIVDYPDIANIAPNIPSSLIINSTTLLQLNLTDEDLRMNFLCDDPDTSDTLTYHLTTFRNSLSQFQLEGSCSDPEYMSVVLGNLNTTKFDNWSFSVNVSDVGGLWSSTVNVTVNLTIRNSEPVIGNVTLDMADSVSIIESGNKTFLFSFVATDADNASDINNLSGIANISRGGETTRHNDTKLYASDGGCNATNNIGVNGINFSCSIQIAFYDGAGEWNITTGMNDTDSWGYNNTMTFTLIETTSIALDINTFAFPLVVPDTYNITSITEIVINNTGNDDLTDVGETLNISAVTLVPSSGTTFIPASNFSFGTVYTNSDECDMSLVTSTWMANKSAAAGFANFTGAINGTTLPAGATGNLEQVELCLIHAPADLASTTYSTANSGAWTIIAF